MKMKVSLVATFYGFFGDVENQRAAFVIYLPFLANARQAYIGRSRRHVNQSSMLWAFKTTTLMG